jgi:hypothetical protein
MKNNRRLYFRVNEELYGHIKSEAKDNGISVAQLCRQKLKTYDKFDRVEFLLNKLNKILENGTK